MKSRVIWLALTALFGLTPGLVRAEWTFQLDSAYQGSGIFQYDLQMEAGPIIVEIELVELAIVPFTNRTAYITTPLGWTASPTNHIADWELASTVPKSFTEIFSAESSAPQYSTTNIWVLFIFDFHNCILNSPFISRNFAGFARIEALVPAMESDGSPSQLSSSIDLAPDPSILELSNESITVETDGNATVLLQASTNLIDWTDVDYFLATPPSTTWTSSVPFPEAGSYLRLRLASLCHESNLVKSTSKSFEEIDYELPTPTPPPIQVPAEILSIHVEGNLLFADVATTSEITHRYRASLLNSNNEEVAAYLIIADESITTVHFPIPTGEGPYFIVVQPVIFAW